MIDVATAHLENADGGWQSFQPTLSLTPRSEKKAAARLPLDREGVEGRLWPSLLRYFPQAPEKLYVQVKAASGSR
jgi:hypothetical protein